MLYFSETVWVFTFSSSLPALEGALESSKGEANGEMNGPRLSLLPASEPQLVLREDIADGERLGLSTGESWYGRTGPLDRVGGIRRESDDSPMAGEPYMPGPNRDDEFAEGPLAAGNKFLE